MVIDESTHPDVLDFLTPVDLKFDMLLRGARFQQKTLVDKCLYLESQNKELVEKNGKLNEKVKKQREFLYSAKDEISQLTKEKTSLELELQQLKEKRRPQTIDISDYDNSIDTIEQQQPNVVNRGVGGSHHTFLSQFRSDGQPKDVPSHAVLGTDRSTAPITATNRQSLEILLSLPANPLTLSGRDQRSKRSFFAESTKIGEINSISSSGRESTASSSRNLNIIPLLRVSSGSSSGTKLSGKMRKSRSLTTQLASRIAANMKIGPPASSHTAQLSSRLQNDKIRKPPTLNRSLRRGTDTSPYFRSGS